jgi:hypothetical protein
MNIRGFKHPAREEILTLNLFKNSARALLRQLDHERMKRCTYQDSSRGRGPGSPKLFGHTFSPYGSHQMGKLRVERECFGQS